MFISVLAALVSFPLFSNDADTATLNLRGEVPELVMIDFSGGLQEDELNFGDLTEAVSQSVTVRFLANVNYSITANSQNGGFLVLAEPDGTGEFLTQIGYSASWGGTNMALGDPDYVVTSNGPGAGTSEVAVTVDEVSFDALELDAGSDTENIPQAGLYEDTITFTITAE